MSSSRAPESKMIEYLNPLQMYRETRKKNYYCPVFLGFSFTDKYARVAMSDDCFCMAVRRGEFPIDDTLLEKLVVKVQNCIDDYELVGVIVEDHNSNENIHDLMYKLCVKGEFESLKYTCWKHDIETRNPTYDRRQQGSFFLAITSPKCLEVYYAQDMLERFLEFFLSLYVNEEEEWEDKDEEREDKDEEREDSERKMIEYLKPLQFFRETTKRDYYKSVILGLHFTDVCAAVAFLCNLNVRTYGVFRRDEFLLDRLVEAVRFLQDDLVENYEFQGIIVDDNNSVENIHNLMDDLCKMGNLKSLKYTCWKDDIKFESTNSTYDRNSFESVVFSAQNMLQRFIDFFILYMVEDAEIEDKDGKSEDSVRKKWCKIIQKGLLGSILRSLCQVNILKFMFGKYKKW